MNELNNLIDKALEKAKQDLNNEKVEVNYTPEFLIGLLEEIKEVANAKPKGDVYEVRKEYSPIFEYDRYYIYKNNYFVLGYDTKEEAQKNIDRILASREEVANV